MFVDFKEIKERFSLEDAIDFLNLDMKRQGDQYRGHCPSCGGSARSLAITPGRGFKCWQYGASGDVIALVAHIEQVRPKEAALKIADHLDGAQTQKNEPDSRHQPNGELKPLSYLQFDHKEHFLDEETARRLGIGFAPKGIMRGHFAVPIRLADGTLAGYIGVKPDAEVQLPKRFGKITKM
jgi:DNA primase